MFIKKSFLIICLVLCLPITSWAGSCELENVSFSGDRDKARYIFLHQEDYDEAKNGQTYMLCCGCDFNRACDVNTRILVEYWHWVGEKAQKPSGMSDIANKFHFCDSSDKGWVYSAISSVPNCSGVDANNHDVPAGKEYNGIVDNYRIFGVRHENSRGRSYNVWWTSMCKAPLWNKCGTVCSATTKDKQILCGKQTWRCESNGVWKQIAVTSAEKCKEQYKYKEGSTELKQCIGCLDDELNWDDNTKTCDCSKTGNNDGIQWRIFSKDQNKCIDDSDFCGGMGESFENGCRGDVGKDVIYACFDDKSVNIKGDKTGAFLKCLGGIELKRWKKVEAPGFNTCVVKDATDKEPLSDKDYTWTKVKDGVFVDQYVNRVNNNGAYGYKESEKSHWCATCQNGNFYNGTECIDNKRQAWCELRKKQDEDNKYNISWTENSCKCGKAGYEWDDNAHECVDNRETFCGLKCGETEDKDNQIVKQGTTVICNADSKIEIKKCMDDFTWADVPSATKENLTFCPTTDPNEQKPDATKYTRLVANDVVFVKNNTKPITDKATNAYKFDEADGADFCRVCGKNKFYYYVDGDDNKGGGCFDTRNEAWCKFKQKKESYPVEWKPKTEGGSEYACMCTEHGKYWNTSNHSCEQVKDFCGLLCAQIYDNKIILCKQGLQLRQCDAAEGSWKPYSPNGASNDWKNIILRQCPSDWGGFDTDNVLLYDGKVEPIINSARDAYEIEGDDNTAAEEYLKEHWCFRCPAGQMYDEDELECTTDLKKAICHNYAVGNDYTVSWVEDEEDSTKSYCECNNGGLWTGERCSEPVKTCAEKCEGEKTSKEKDEVYSPKEQCLACCEISGADWLSDGHKCDCKKDSKKIWNGQTNTCDETYDEKIKDAISSVSPFFENVEKNKTVWRTAEGKFNTTRLASDAIAGTVLGTVGGIVSANVIKKKQLAKGYDVLHCAIGGQNVADWGDTFNVVGPGD